MNQIHNVLGDSMTQQTGGLIMAVLAFMCFAAAAVLSVYAVTQPI